MEKVRFDVIIIAQQNERFSWYNFRAVYLNVFGRKFNWPGPKKFELRQVTKHFNDIFRIKSKNGIWLISKIFIKDPKERAKKTHPFRTDLITIATKIKEFNIENFNNIYHNLFGCTPPRPHKKMKESAGML